ncbi:TonB-dependent receptor [Nitrospirillum bahiense]|uniref:Outer membrane receptor protein involved in Fe transport n=2 Tax=Nitrospirillum amazonense TaxID=28077 RepID=A0A560GDM4_9PROT|nr:TonB-dependent receptor plug domain-containing protein [Nitrospirillum amazonense]TWB31919.1 outer membrane receptor protein involved in Fe transport [Nitrospirillum amazonense]
MGRFLTGITTSLLLLSCPAALAAGMDDDASSPVPLDDVVVTAARRDLIGTAATSSQGVVVKEELDLLPAYRVGQMLETVPGLVVTSHSGEGKANQYLLRGFNLDHGTDMATSVDGMPVNMRTHAHGQGYTDLNFVIPELASGIGYTKGPYFAAQGDFSAVGSIQMGYLDEVPAQVALTAGTLGYQRAFAAGTTKLGAGQLMAGGELVHYDGPWDHPDNLRKGNAVLRYSQGARDDGFSVTAMYYRGLWNATTDQPERAIAQGLIGRYGTLDPTDGGQARRMSLSGTFAMPVEAGWLAGGEVTANAYVINNQLTLWNNFTHFLDNPVQGDQHAQDENRMVAGGAVSYSRLVNLLGLDHEVVAGLDTRFDDVHVDLRATRARVAYAQLSNDNVQETGGGAYVQATSHWTPWLRTVVGMREDYLTATDHGSNAGVVAARLFQPKGSAIATLWQGTEVYLSAGRGFHSDDVRGASQGNAPLLAKADGEEVGIRSTILPNLTATLTAFQMDFVSELTYDADVGQTEAGRPSRRRGVELNTTYNPFSWLEFYGSMAFSHARYTDSDPAGSFIPDAPKLIGSLGIYLRDLGPWSGGVEYRYFGAHPLVEDNSVHSSGSQEWNLTANYTLQSGLRFGIGLYNVFDSKDDAADYYYTDRLKGEPAEGVGDLHAHPLEPRSVRFTVAQSF